MEPSTREKEIVLLAAEGLTDKEIATRLHLQVATVRTYWERLRNKLGAVNKSQAIAKTLRTLVTEQERWQQLIVECAADYAMFAIDLNGHATSWNEGVERILGYRESDFLGLNADLIFTPEDRAAGAPDKEKAKALETGKAADRRWHQRKDGSRFYGVGTMVSLKQHGELLGFAKILQDLTELWDLQQQVEKLKSGQ